MSKTTPSLKQRLIETNSVTNEAQTRNIEMCEALAFEVEHSVLSPRQWKPRNIEEISQTSYEMFKYQLHDLHDTTYRASCYIWNVGSSAVDLCVGSQFWALSSCVFIYVCVSLRVLPTVELILCQIYLCWHKIILPIVSLLCIDCCTLTSNVWHDVESICFFSIRCIRLNRALSNILSIMPCAVIRHLLRTCGTSLPLFGNSPTSVKKRIAGIYVRGNELSKIWTISLLLGMQMSSECEPPVAFKVYYELLNPPLELLYNLVTIRQTQTH